MRLHHAPYPRRRVSSRSRRQVPLVETVIPVRDYKSAAAGADVEERTDRLVQEREKARKEGRT